MLEVATFKKDTRKASRANLLIKRYDVLYTTATQKSTWNGLRWEIWTESLSDVKQLEPNVSYSREAVWKSGKEKVKTGLKHLVKVERGGFRTLPNIYDGGFCKNSRRLLAFNYFAKRSILKVWQGSGYTSVPLSI